MSMSHDGSLELEVAAARETTNQGSGASDLIGLDIYPAEALLADHSVQGILHIYIYIYMSMCVCQCECVVYICNSISLHIYTYICSIPLHIYIYMYVCRFHARYVAYISSV
jgi:hypothetical protein